MWGPTKEDFQLLLFLLGAIGVALFGMGFILGLVVG